MDIGLGIILLFDISGHSCVDDDLELWKQRICRELCSLFNLDGHYASDHVRSRVRPLITGLTQN